LSIRGCPPREHQSQNDSRIGELMGKQTSLGVHEDQPNHEEAEDAKLQRQPGDSEGRIAGDEKNSNQKLHGGITQRYGPSALATPASKQDPTEQGNIVVPENRSVAPRTKRARRDDRQIAWNTADADVEEAAKSQSNDEQRAFEKEIQALLEYVVACG